VIGNMSGSPTCPQRRRLYSVLLACLVGLAGWLQSCLAPSASVPFQPIHVTDRGPGSPHRHPAFVLSLARTTNGRIPRFGRRMSRRCVRGRGGIATFISYLAAYQPLGREARRPSRPRRPPPR